MDLLNANKSHKRIILVLSGTLWQIPIVKKIHEMGFLSLVINLHEDSPAFEVADHWEVADILDKEKCVAIAEKYAVSGVVSEQCDIAVPTVAYIAEKIGLPALKIDSAELYTNKLSMRKFCQKHGFSYPEYSLCRNSNEVLHFFNKTKREIIIKPLDANSSRGIHSIDNKANIPQCFSDAVSYSKRENAVIAERYISGPEFTIDGIVAHGKHHSLAVSIKSHYQHNKNIAYELFFSHLHEQYDYDLLRRINDRFIEQSKLREGTLTHSEYKFEDGNFYLIETAARGGGNLVASHIVPLMSGFDNYRFYLNTATDSKNPDSPVSIDDKLKEQCAVLHFFTTTCPSGIVRAINGKNFLDSCPNVIAFRLNFSIGDTITEASNDASRIGFYIAYAESEDKLLSLQKQINQRFSIRMEPL
jgi:carbamoyl-phosphate synthase large subunit